MSFFAHEEEKEEPKNHLKPFNLFSEAMKQAFGQCCTFLPITSPSFDVEEEEEYSINSDVEYEQEAIIFRIQTLAMEAKLRRKNGFSSTNSSSRWAAAYPVRNEEGIETNNDEKEQQQKEVGGDFDETETIYYSVGSHCCSSSTAEIFFSAGGSCFSRCSSTGRVIEFSKMTRKRSILQEFCHCEGWPFGLCRKELLLPPLPTSPSESWLKHRGGSHQKLKMLN